MSTGYENLLEANANWAASVLGCQPDFFEQSAKGQSPHTLWIGCSDSRVPESVITAARPGDIFVQRNIANQLHLDDCNTLSVLRYAVTELGVQHVIIVGHSECGGAKASLKAAQSNLDPTKPIWTIADEPIESPLNRWLEPLTRMVVSLQISTVNTSEALPIIVEENIKLQVRNLAYTATIREAWNDGIPVQIHGWIYELSTGLLRDLNVSQGPPHNCCH